MNKTVVFDLDDTLVYEIDYLKSAFKEIAYFVDNKNIEKTYSKMIEWFIQDKDVFNELCRIQIGLNKETLIKLYRSHVPNLKANDESIKVLEYLSNRKYRIGLISDGYSVTQRNKIKSAKIDKYFDDIIISEEFGSDKLSRRNFEFFHKNHSDQYFYIGDNTNKDFLNPNRLGWVTICLLDKGYNIHKQNFEIKDEFKPRYLINNLIDSLEIIENNTNKIEL